MFIEKQDFVKLSLSFAVNIVFGLNVLQAHHTTTTTALVAKVVVVVAGGGVKVDNHNITMQQP